MSMRNSLRWRLIHRVARRSPLLYLNWQALRGRRPAYGCKLTPNYVPDVTDVVPHLYRNGYRIIHLQRQDVFQTAISSTVAAAARHWITKVGDQLPSAPSLHVDPAAFQETLRELVHLQALKQQSVAGVPHLEIIYEDDLADAACRSATMARVFDHLGLPFVSVQSTVNKTWNRPYQEIIVNYAELEDIVADSELASVLSPAMSAQQPGRDQREGKPTC